MKFDKYTVMKFVIPLGLAIAAAAFQSLAIRKIVQTDLYLVLARDLEPGDVIRPEDIQSENISTHYAPPGAILKNDSSVAVGSSVIRAVKANHLLLRDDLLIDRHTLSLSDDEVPVTFKIEDGVVRSNSFHVGQNVHLLFYNEGESISIDNVTHPSKQDIEIGPLRIVSIGSAIAPYSEAPDEKVRTVSVAINRLHKDRALLFKVQDRESEISLRGIYSRPTKN